ncbi:MAG: DUF1566 domain-containing protein [Flavobacteriales bacterium]|nr:DUF1566 domain-containing protein [Flavobacteriales bacterium]
MKKTLTLVLSLLISASVWAQSPDKMSYQAVIRDTDSKLVTSQGISMRISILKGSGISVYTETHTTTTNVNGLVSIEIGSGDVVSGPFSTIDWSDGPYFIKTETDLAGGSDYTIEGTSQLMSVPYALYAKSSGNGIGAQGIQGEPGQDGEDGIGGVSSAGANVSISGAGSVADPYIISATSSGARYLGEQYGGGIIYHLYIGSDGQQHGLIVNKTESTAVWQATGTETSATRSWDGAYNTALMSSSAAASYVNALSDGGFTWYLPSIDELSLLWHSRFTTNEALNAGSFTLLSNTANYWSSTETNTTYAFLFEFIFGYANLTNKNNPLSVRGVRAF